MRLPPAILGSTEEVLREILRFTAPADVTLSRYFKDHQRLGSRERGVVAEAVYAVLRNKTFFTDFGGSGGTPSSGRSSAGRRRPTPVASTTSWSLSATSLATSTRVRTRPSSAWQG